MVKASGSVKGGGGRIENAISHARVVRTAIRREPGISGKVPLDLRRKGYVQDGGLVLMQHGHVPGSKEESPILTVIDVGQDDRSTNCSAEVIEVDGRLEER